MYLGIELGLKTDTATLTSVARSAKDCRTLGLIAQHALSKSQIEYTSRRRVKIASLLPSPASPQCHWMCFARIQLPRFLPNHYLSCIRYAIHSCRSGLSDQDSSIVGPVDWLETFRSLRQGPESGSLSLDKVSLICTSRISSKNWLQFDSFLNISECRHGFMRLRALSLRWVRSLLRDISVLWGCWPVEAWARATLIHCLLDIVCNQMYSMKVYQPHSNRCSTTPARLNAPRAHLYTLFTLLCNVASLTQQFDFCHYLIPNPSSWWRYMAPEMLRIIP